MRGGNKQAFELGREDNIADGLFSPDKSFVGLGLHPANLLPKNTCQAENISVGPVTVEAIVPSRAKMVICSCCLLERPGGRFDRPHCPFHPFLSIDFYVNIFLHPYNTMKA